MTGLARGVAWGVVLFGIVPVSRAGVSFLARKDLSVGPGCCSLLSADFNHDGKIDLAVSYADSEDTVQSGAGDTSLAILLGDGNGNFEFHALGGPFGASVRLVAVSDVNRDSHPDILAVSSLGTLLLLGRGDGSFQPPIVLDSDQVVAVGDFNADGKPDLFSYTQDGTGFNVRLGNGDGTFQAPVGFTKFPAGDFRFAVIADFNGDGKADVAQTSARPDPNLYVWLGNGDGTFQSVTVSVIETVAGSSVRPLVAADFNRDGKMDLAVGGRNGLTILLGNGDGTFSAKAVYSDPGETLALGDLNGDGKLDLVDGFSVLLGNGDGTFQAPVLLDFGQPVGNGGGSLIIADFENLGKLDVAASYNFLEADAGGLETTSFAILTNSSNDASVSGVSAANALAVLAPDSIGSVYGTELAGATASASAASTPATELGGISLQVRDSAGVARLAQLLYVSPTQINFVLPAEAAVGYATLNIETGPGSFVEGARATLVQTVAPGIFTADQTGTGVAAATAVRVLPSGEQMPVPVFQCSPTGCTAVAIDLTGDPVYLSLYGTGLRNTLNLSPEATGATCQVAGFDATVAYVGAQGYFAGLDQVNILLPRLSGLGEVDLICSFQSIAGYGVDAKTVRISIK
jgi:uncharacterized protein (TIGR03437 family)